MKQPILLFLSLNGLIAPLWAADHRPVPEPAAAMVSAPGSQNPVAPGEDFFRFVNGAWETATELPADTAVWSAQAQLRRDNLRKMAELYRAAAKASPAPRPAAKKVGDYYWAQMDQAGIEAKGLAPIRPLLGEIAALDSKSALAGFLGRRLQADVDPVNLGVFNTENLFGLWVGPGLQDPEHYQAYMLQGGLGLPNPGFYLSSAPEQKATYDAYRNYIVSLLEQAGIGDAKRKAQGILELETQIAKTHASREASTDLSKTGSLWRRDDFKSKAKGLDWDAYFAAAGLPAEHAIGAWQPDAIRGISALVATTPLEVWKDYLAFHALSSNARFLPKALANRFFAFFDPLFIGPGQHRPLWDHVVNQTNTDMPGAGQLFVERHFSAQAKAEAQDIVSRIVTAFGQRIEGREWMSPATKKAALAKLQAMQIGVGYPDQWRDSSGLDIRVDDAFGNVQRVRVFNREFELAKLGRPVDRREWILGGELFGINPMPLQNALTIPVTALQPPFFDPNGSDADNYAALGARIGRFIALSFDEQGSRFDAQGRLRPWWTAADRAQFKKTAEALSEQYSRYQPLPDLAVNGERTLNDNIADLAGLQAAFDAYRQARKVKAEQGDEHAADQRFFIAYAQSLRLKSTEQALRRQTLGSPQAPAKYRAATVRNLDAWYTAFDVRPGQALYLAPSARVRIW